MGEVLTPNEIGLLLQGVRVGMTYQESRDYSNLDVDRTEKTLDALEFRQFLLDLSIDAKAMAHK